MIVVGLIMIGVAVMMGVGMADMVLVIAGFAGRMVMSAVVAVSVIVGMIVIVLMVMIVRFQEGGIA
jgi:hypothetical protein